MWRGRPWKCPTRTSPTDIAGRLVGVKFCGRLDSSEGGEAGIPFAFPVWFRGIHWDGWKGDEYDASRAALKVGEAVLGGIHLQGLAPIVALAACKPSAGYIRE